MIKKHIHIIILLLALFILFIIYIKETFPIIIGFIFAIGLFILHERVRKIWEDNDLIRNVIKEMEYNIEHMIEDLEIFNNIKSKPYKGNINIKDIPINFGHYQFTFMNKLLMNSKIYIIFDNSEIRYIQSMIDVFNKDTIDYFDNIILNDNIDQLLEVVTSFATNMKDDIDNFSKYIKKLDKNILTINKLLEKKIW